MKHEIILINWACIFIMLVGMLMIIFMRKKIDYVPKKFYNLSFYALLISTSLYIIKAIFMNIHPSRSFYMIIIYLDWLIITPMLINILGSIGMYYDHKNKKLVLGIIFVYLIMTISFITSNNTTGFTSGITLLISCVFFIINFWLIWGPLENIASLQGCYEYKLYKLLALFTTIIWIGYPALWGIGPRVLDIIDHKLYIYFRIIIPTIYKLGFIFIALHGVKKVNKIKQN